MLLNKISSNILAVFSGIALAAILITSVPLLSGSMQEENIKPMIVVSSIEFYKKSIPLKKKKQTKIKKKPRKLKKKPKKIIKKIKKPKNKIVKKQVVKPIDKLFATKNKIIKKIPQTQEINVPDPEPIYRLSERPYFLHKSELNFPMDMRKLGKSAIVTLDALIDRKGRVRQVTIYKSAGKSFDDAAILAIKDSIFVPGKINGKSVATLYRTDLKFTLK